MEFEQSKFLMECAREHTEATKGTKWDMCKINAVRKCEWVFLSCETLVARGMNLTNYDRNELEVSSVCRLPIESAKRSKDSKRDKINND